MLLTLSRRRSAALLALLLLGQPTSARADDAPPDPALAPTTGPLDGRVACPSLSACCVPGEELCVHPGASRAVLAGAAGLTFGAGVGLFVVAGDSLNAGDPMGALVGIGMVGLAGSALGLIADLITPGPAGRVSDRAGRPTIRLSLSPGGSSTLDESSPYGLGIRVDPNLVLSHDVSIQPHVGLSVGLGNSTHVDPRPQAIAASSEREAGFPVGWSTHRMKVSAGAELAVRLPYPIAVKRPLYTGAVEIRWKPRWELRRRLIQPGASDQQIVEHSALYPVNVGLRWHVAPRQRFTVYAGPRIDWLSFTDPGSATLRRGKAVLGSFYGEAWWQLDIPFSPHGRKPTSVTGRFNLGYIHSNLDGERLDVGSIVGYFGPLEASFDLRIRKVGAPVAAQISVGYRLATGGGAFLEIGLVTPDIHLGAH